MPPVLLKKARIMDPSRDLDRTSDLLAADGRISRIDQDMSAPSSARVVDCRGLWLWPGLIDPHVHFRDPGFTRKEDLHSGGRAAAAGGYTAVICEPNTSPPIDTPSRAAELLHRAEKECPVRLFVKGAMTRGREGREMADLRGLARVDGVVAFSDDGDPVVSRSLMERICRSAADLDLPVSPHPCDSPAAVEAYGSGVDPGFEPGPAYENEWRYVRRDLDLAARHGCQIHLSHISQARSVREIMSAREDIADTASRMTFESTPHHLTLCSGDYGDGKAPDVNPPIRSSQDRRALRRAVRRGNTDAIAADHAPHTAEDKKQGASGLIGLETTLGVVMTSLVHAGELSPLRAAEMLSTSPARIFGLPGGSLQPGEPADIALVDPREEWTVAPEQFQSKSRNTPFDGWRLQGRAVATLRGGELIYETSGFEERRGAEA